MNVLEDVEKTLSVLMAFVFATIVMDTSRPMAIAGERRAFST